VDATSPAAISWCIAATPSLRSGVWKVYLVNNKGDGFCENRPL